MIFLQIVPILFLGVQECKVFSASALQSALSACQQHFKKNEKKLGTKCSVFVHIFWTNFILILVSPKFHVQKRNFHFNLNS
jgi:hypothetical protein